jgi:colicin import membrane protein
MRCGLRGIHRQAALHQRLGLRRRPRGAAAGRSSIPNRRGCPCSCSAGSAPRRHAPTPVGGQRQKAAAGAGIAAQRRDGERSVSVSSSSATSSMASMARIEASAALSPLPSAAAASMSCRWMPLLKKSAPPASTSTRVGRSRNLRSACTRRALALAHRAVVEVEGQPAHAGLPAGRIRHSAARPIRRRRVAAARAIRAARRPRRRRRVAASLSGATRTGRRSAHMADPHAASPCSAPAAPARGAPSRRRAAAERRRASHRGAGRVGVEQLAGLAEQRAGHAGKTVGAAQRRSASAASCRAASRWRGRPAASAAASRAGTAAGASPASAVGAGKRRPTRGAHRASAACTAWRGGRVTSRRYRLALVAAAHRKACRVPGPAPARRRSRQWPAAPSRPSRVCSLQHRPWSSADGPRSPGGPGCTTRQGRRCHTEAGIARFRKGASTTSGSNSAAPPLRSPRRRCRVRRSPHARRRAARRTAAAPGR